MAERWVKVAAAPSEAEAPHAREATSLLTSSTTALASRHLFNAQAASMCRTISLPVPETCSCRILW